LTRDEPIICPDDVEYLLVSDLLFSPDGRLLMALDMQGGLRVWDATTGKLLYKRLEDGLYPGPAVFSADGRRIVFAATNLFSNTSVRRNVIRVVDAENGKQMSEWKQSTGVLTLSSDSRRLLVNGDDGAKLLDADSGGELLSIPFSRNSRGYFTASSL